MAEYQSFRIADMPVDERPRERLERHGAESLTTPELIAILFRTGTGARNAVGLAEDLYRSRGGLAGLARANLEELCAVAGVGRVKAIEIKAALELGKRLHTTTEEMCPYVRSAADVAQLVMADLRHEEREQVKILLLDTRNAVRRMMVLSQGTLNESILNPREVLTQVLRHNCAAYVIVHNHPSGDPTPSGQDISITLRLKQASDMLDVKLVDHVIIGDGRWYSLKENRHIRD